MTQAMGHSPGGNGWHFSSPVGEMAQDPGWTGDTFPAQWAKWPTVLGERVTLFQPSGRNGPGQWANGWHFSSPVGEMAQDHGPRGDTFPAQCMEIDGSMNSKLFQSLRDDLLGCITDQSKALRCVKSFTPTLKDRWRLMKRWAKDLWIYYRELV